MKLILFYYKCGKCGKVFNSPQLGEGLYGEFLMRTKKGEIAYLNAITDKVFDEASLIFNRVVSDESADDVDLFQGVFGETCDLSSSGESYNILQKPVCPTCKIAKIADWGEITPPEIVDLDIPHVTHKNWEKLSRLEKEEKLNNAITKLLAKNA